MRQLTLFKPPIGFTRRLDELKENPELGYARAALLLQVELGFALMERLGFDDEPVTALWTILSGMPLRHPRLQNLDEMERRAIANARQITPFSARFTWLGALRAYMQIPQHWRNYDFDQQDLDSQIINAAKQLRNPIHQNLYEACLSETLGFYRRDVRQVEVGIIYQFEAKTEEESVTLQVEFAQERLDAARLQPISWFTEPCSRIPFSLRIADLESDALYVDEREQVLAERYGWDNAAKGNWVSRFRRINFHKVQADGTVIQEEEQTLELDGFSHVPGMVASGKSTFARLLAINVLRHYPEQRITLVVGDVQSAIQTANQINWWFCDDPEHNTPVAVPILGRSQRDAHLRSFYASKDCQAHWQRGQPHWGDRWLGTACPLQGLLRSSDIAQRLNGKPIKPGSEPCYSLKKAPSNDRERRRKTPSPSHLCPFFVTCPSQQVYRDLPNARVWITTPGAMAMAGLPRQLESRPIKVGELVYEQSNIVVFDEADTIIQWFDNVYAEEVTLTNGNNGIFDEIGEQTEAYKDRVSPPLTQRWTGAERSAQQAITASLTMLDERSGHKILQDWIARGYFTPSTLFFKFARRLAGLEEFDPPDISEAELRANTELVQSIARYFDILLDEDPLLMRPRSNPQVEQLASLIQQINSTGESATDEAIHRACKAWIRDFFPKTKKRLVQLRKLKQSDKDLQQSAKKKHASSSKQEKEESDPVDTVETLAYRLQFALTIALLDRHTRIVFYEWYNCPSTVDDEPPRRRMPSAMLNVLPLPPTGRQFGTYYSRQNNRDSKSENSSSNVLSLFAYANIGRCYVLNFHRLLTDFDGLRGPNVLALSGTSYLPHSTRFHIGEPQGVLMPELKASEAIAKSHFKFLPQYKRKEPIRISGKPEHQKMGLFKDMVRSLVGNNGTGDLGQELRELKLLGENNPDYWFERDHILLLVNSYNQARWAADEIYNCWSSVRESVYYLTPDNGETDAEDDVENKPRTTTRIAGAKPLNRADIETFGQTGGKILIAPMNAIGRGFNILNANSKAAFGAVYFLTRPYPHPHDTQAIAQEMNRHALDWVNDADFVAWQEDSVTQRAEAVRQLAGRYWRSIEQRSYYKTLDNDDELRAYPRLDLAATTAGLVIQAVGRLLRGGVPFHAYFVDAAWAPNSANRQLDKLDTEKSSLLVAIILRLGEYTSETGKVGYVLYKPLADALEKMGKNENLYW